MQEALPAKLSVLVIPSFPGKPAHIRMKTLVESGELRCNPINHVPEPFKAAHPHSDLQSSVKIIYRE